MDIALLMAAVLILAGAGLVGVLLLAASRARRRFEAQLDAGHTRLRAAETHLAGIKARAGAFPSDLPAPFVSCHDDLDAALAHAQATATALQAHRRALLHGAGQPPSGGDLIDTLPLARWLDEPRRWRRLEADATDVETALAGLEAGVQVAAAALARLEEVPARVAAACTGLAARAGQAVDLAAELSGRGVHGPALDRAGSTARDLAARLATACTSTPRDTAAASELFELLSVPVAETHAQVQAWADQVRRLDQVLADAARALDDAAKRIASLPPAVDRAELADRLTALQNNGQTVAQEAARPDAHALAGLVTRAGDLVEAAGLLADDADATAHKQIEFAAHYGRAHTTLTRATAEMQAAAGEPIYPLDWREWAGRCAAAGRALALLGDPAAPRAARSLEADGAVAARVAGQAARLLEAVGQARLQRDALRRLLVLPALTPDRPWEARAAALHDAANTYAPENWPAEGRVPHLRADAAALADEHARWVPREPWLPLPVDTLHRRLEAVQHLAAELQAFEPALARVEQELAALRAMEAEAREALAGCCRDVTRLVDRVRAARPPYERPVTGHLGPLRQLARHGEALEAAFARRDQGTVAVKAQRAQRWARATAAHLKSMCRALDAAAGEARAALGAELETWTQVFRLDAEPAVASAAAQANVPYPKRQKVRGAPLARAAADLAYALALAADRQAVYQARHDLAAATRRLPEPLQAWRAARDEARAAWDHLEATRQALAAAWPPLAPDTGRPGRLFEGARRARDEARREEERHLAGARYVPEAATRLQALNEAYRHAATAAAEAQVAARQAHARLQAAAEALEAALTRAPNPEVEREIDRLRRQWSRRPPAEDEAIQELDRLRFRLRSQP